MTFRKILSSRLPLDQVLTTSGYIALTVTIAHALAYALTLGPPAQLLTALLFYTTCPGTLILDWIHVDEIPAKIAVAVSASLAFNTLVATVLLAINRYSAFLGLAIISLATFIMIALSLFARYARHAASI